MGSGVSDSEGGQHEHRGSDPTSLLQWDAERPSVTPSGCNPTHSRLQPYVPRLQPYLTCRADHPLRLSAHALNGSVVLGLRPRRQQRGGGRGAGQAALAGGGFVPMWKAGFAQISANWLSAGRFQRQLVIQAAPKPRPASASLGQPRPISRVGCITAGWPHRPCFPHRSMPGAREADHGRSW